MSDAQALVVFDFGTGRNGNLGAANLALARLTRRWPGLPVLAQREVACALARRGRLVVDLGDHALRFGRLGRSDYIDTSQVARAAAAIAERAGWHTLGVLAHPGHLLRCVATLETAGVRAVSPALGRDDVDFDRRSGQWWTRGREAWTARELAVIAHQRLAGHLRT